MTLSPEQKQAVTSWVAAGDTLSAVQQKLSEQFKISLTYMDVRFLVDDLGLELKSAAPRTDANADLTGARPAAGTPDKKGGLLNRLKKAVGVDSEAPGANDNPADGEGDLADEVAGSPVGGGVQVTLDRVVRPGAVASGTVSFSDGVSGKWGLDQYGRLMLDLGRKGYQPSAPDVQAFQRELSRLLEGQAY
jgi:hypothetical protein